MNEHNLRFDQNFNFFSLMILMFGLIFFVKAHTTFVVKSTDDTVVLGNYFHLNVYGEALPKKNGFQITTGLSENNTIGCVTPYIIFGDTSIGIIISGIKVLKNLIGFNTNGYISIPNNVGVFIFNSGENTIGGTIWSDTPPP